MPYLFKTEPIPASTIRFEFEPPTRTNTFPDIDWFVYSGLPLPEGLRSKMAHTLLVGPPNGKNLPDMIGMSGGPYVICPKLKEKIEELEPGIHEFFPLNVKRDNGSKEYGTYYLLYVTQAFDAVIWDKTVFSGGPDNRGLAAAKKAAFQLRTNDNPGWCTLKREVIEGRHLWRAKVSDESLFQNGGDPMRNKYFCSAELRDFIAAEKLIGWMFWEVSEE